MEQLEVSTLSFSYYFYLRPSVSEKGVDTGLIYMNGRGTR